MRLEQVRMTSGPDGAHYLLSFFCLFHFAYHATRSEHCGAPRRKALSNVQDLMIKKEKNFNLNVLPEYYIFDVASKTILVSSIPGSSKIQLSSVSELLDC